MNQTANKQTILRERAQKLAARGAQLVARPLLERIIVVETGGERYGLAIAQVREITRATPVAPLPNLPPFMPGICAVHGELVPVVDLAELRGHGRTGSSAFFAIVEISGRVLALLFSQLLEMRDVHGDELVTGLLQEEMSQAFLRAMTRDGVSVVDLERLVLSELLMVGRVAATAPERSA